MIPDFRRLRRAMVHLLVVVTCTPTLTAAAQSGPTGTLAGVVTDSSGAVVAGASLTVTHIGKGYKRLLSTDGEGRFRATALEVGAHQVVVEVAGFKKVIFDQVDIEAAVPRTLDVKLEPGAVAERGGD
jgi:hypothetical protein